MSDHGLMYEILYGHKPDEPEPAEFKVFRKVAVQLLDLKPLGYSIVRQVSTIGVKNDLGDYLPYLFFAFHAAGGNRNWPQMSGSNAMALKMGRWVLGASATVPNYTREIVTPPSELERNVDQALVDLAKWCMVDMRNALTVHYIKTLKAHQAAYAKVSDEPDAGSAVIYIKTAFEERVSSNPTAFPSGDNIYRMIRFMAI